MSMDDKRYGNILSFHIRILAIVCSIAEWYCILFSMNTVVEYYIIW